MGWLPGRRLAVRPDGPGARLVLDAQGRLPLPAWLRRSPNRSLLIGTDPTAPLFVIAPAGVLDGFGPLLTGGPR